MLALVNSHSVSGVANCVIWAGAPFLWQLYVQDDGAHNAKLAAFLDLYFASADPALEPAARAAFARWNGANAAGSLEEVVSSGNLAQAWKAHALARREAFGGQPDLVTRLIAFVEAKR